MKNRILIIGILSCILTIASSCTKFLNLAPLSEYSAGNYYKTQQDFEMAIPGVYAGLRTAMTSELFKNLEARSDNVDAFHPNQYNHGYAILSMFAEDPQTPTIELVWRSFWVVIDRSNAILDQIDGGTFIDEERRGHLKGEALFLRGFAYFQLGWLYGGVPQIDRQMTTEEIRVLPRSTQEQTLAFAENDLKLAMDLLPPVWPTNELGKATRYAAAGILARLYFFQRQFTKAKPLLEDIISSDKYQMANTFAECFLDNLDNGPEHVFQIQFTNNNALVAALAPVAIRNSMFPAGGGPDMNVTYDLYNSYEPTDVRRDFTILKGFNTVSGVVDNSTLLYIKYAHGKIPNTKTNFDVNLPVLRYTDVRLMYAEVLNEEAYVANGEAFDILNEVRDRAGLDPLTSATVPNQQAFREAILLERRLEFACEALRWFDLVRTDKAMQVINNLYAKPEQGSGTYKMEEYHKLWPIPQYELNINPDRNYVWQNPGHD